MAARLKTKPSTHRLSEVARHVVIPEGIASTGWPGIEAKCREWGDEFDRWQADLGRVILGKRADGLYAATVGGVTLSIPRQVAKTFLVGRIVFALCVLFPGTKVLWTAHHTATLGNTFRSLLGFARRKSVAPYISATRRGSGKEAIEFHNGSVIYFGARSQGFGRGFDEVDVEVFDEAQILDAKALEDMVAATNQSRHPHGALLFYMGTPPRPTDPGEEFAARRRKALAAKPDARVVTEHGEAVYVECSADSDTGRDGGPSLDSVEQLRKANPSYPHRTPPASVKRLRANLSADDSWRREGLGIWDDPASAGIVTDTQWASCEDATSELDSPPHFALDVSPNHSWSAIAVAGKRLDGLSHVEVTNHNGVMDVREGTDWVVPRFVGLSETFPGLVLTIAGGSAAESLVPALVAAGVLVEFVKANDVAAACGLFFDLATTGKLRHLGQPELTSALHSARRRDIGDGAWAWGRRKSNADITPLYSATLALWASRQAEIEPNCW